MTGKFRWTALAACAFLVGQSFAQQGKPVAISIQVAAGLVYMPGEVNHSWPLSVVLDTGSSLTVASPAVARSAGLKSSGTTEAAGLGKGQGETLQLFDNADLNWGNPADRLQLLQQKGAILPIDYISEEVGERTDAIFGSNLFRHYQITVDYERQRAVFARPDSAAPASGGPVPIQIFGDVPFVDAKITGEDGKAVSGLFFVDSGTTGNMLLKKEFLQAHPHVIAPAHLVDAPTVTAVGGEIRLKRALSRVALGPFVFSEVVAGIPDSGAGVLANESVAGIIGAGILRRFRVTWD